MARMIVAKTGSDVFSDKRELALDSAYPNLMIVDEQSIAGTTTEYSHNLGYIPAVFAFYRFDGIWQPIEAPVYDSDDEWTGFTEPRISIDTNKLYFNNTDEMPIRVIISANASDGAEGTGKNTAIGKLKISRGDDINTITDARKFTFCSGLDTFKKDELKSGEITISRSGGNIAIGSFSHNLGYVPLVSAYLKSEPDSSWNGMILPANIAVSDFAPVTFYITSSKVTFIIDGSAPNGDYVIKYNTYRNKIS